MIKITVRNNRVGPIRGRHPWVFSGALLNIPNGLESGMPVCLVDEQDNFLAQGYFNSYSQIAVRVWSWDANEEINTEFFEKRIKTAYEIRKNFVASKNTDSYRLVNSENDLLPGLIVDKYADCLSVQFHTQGMGHWKKEVLEALVKIVKPKGIFERSDVGNRAKESSVMLSHTITPASTVTPNNIVIQSEEKDPLKTLRDFSTPLHSARNDNQRSNVGLLYGKVPAKIKITENGLKFLVDVVGGQKTGFFLDQRDKRAALVKYVKGKNVLNCFSYTGGFSVYALDGGAKKVTSVDVSESALQIAEENVLLNKFEPTKADFLQADVKVYLNDLVNGQVEEKFDVIVLDPPAFIKDRHKVKEGIQGYRRINEMAMRLLPSGGILVSASCSAHLSLPDFRYMLSEAAGRAGRTLQILETYTHGIDHPELVAFTEGEYLKCVFAIVD